MFQPFKGLAQSNEVLGLCHGTGEATCPTRTEPRTTMFHGDIASWRTSNSLCTGDQEIENTRSRLRARAEPASLQVGELRTTNIDDPSKIHLTKSTTTSLMTKGLPHARRDETTPPFQHIRCRHR